MYVVSIEPETRTVVIGTAGELAGRAVTLSDLNWLAEPLAPGDLCAVQVRYRARAVPARVAGPDAAGTGLALELLEPVRAITPGQSGVLYHGDRLLGGGIIQ
jgi:tRNA-specific 2-thiouridylase